MRIAELHGGSPGVPRVKAGSDAEGAFFVEWEPPELRPFALRYRWWTMVDEELEDGDPDKYVEWANPPEVISPDPPADWTGDHRRTFRDNYGAFERYAECLRHGEIPIAIQIRAQSLELDGTRYKRVPPEKLPNRYLLALTRRVQELQREGITKTEMGTRRMVDRLSRETLHHRLAEAKRRGLG